METKCFQFNSEVRNIPNLSYTENLYLGNFIKPKINENDEWYESADDDVIENYFDNQKLLVEKYLIENNVYYNGRGIDIQLDFYEFFKGKEKKYTLKGNPLSKDYVYIKDNVEILVCRISYNKKIEPINYQGFIKNEFIGLFSKYEFFRENGKSEIKIIDTLDFDLIPTIIYKKDSNQNNTEEIEDVLWSSVKREEILREERYKADEKMKTFNPALYYMLTKVFSDSYNHYLQSGDSIDLKNELQNAPIPKLQEQVSDEDELALGLPTSYQITILNLILNALQ